MLFRRALAATAVLTAIPLGLSACTTVTPVERKALAEAAAVGIDEQEIKDKDPTAAALLNILPGIGNFYLAGGGNDEHIWAGIANLITWPLSIVWGIPSAAIDAEQINRKETAEAWILGGEAEVRKRAENPNLYK